MDNKLCCLLNNFVICGLCGFRLCEVCHTATGRDYAHSHSVTIRGDKTVPFFCPSAQKSLLWISEGEPMPVDTSPGSVHFQIEHLNFIIRGARVLAEKV